ncbi:hypothetical protein Bbelb_391410 [Branchiostoma belcheri]|nr:hypothetical protein Bbelb_391410 [Branchiostoma belcheri]
MSFKASRNSGTRLEVRRLPTHECRKRAAYLQRKTEGVVVDWYAIDIGEGDVTFAQFYMRLVVASECRPDRQMREMAEVYGGLKVGQATLSAQFGCFVLIIVDKTATTKAEDCQQKSGFEDVKDTISPNQFGCVKGRSTTHCLVSLANQLYKSADKRRTCSTIQNDLDRLSGRTNAKK